ncbi:hypothetical protein HQ325_16700 [Rhodococcus sp. BP-349]|nr:MULTISPECIES: hypothetical protein [unclassified Rhodococcus (in: high G+C Gram-positive bacteria)]MBY6597157.1 hypothetical protein [Rhodococcus sp. BP-359]MBY6604825.1 hypothetical protein [Rhodococcus sp. BP-351]MBY6623183.1 hypothetical protein [Rhodococcus sp. BP-357]MBY6540315.1 hypothetical protein [Rhodococcus sp. BP-363]MBY6601496.1 hypothetical protein [Rhodococcus sp. BP-353]
MVSDVLATWTFLGMFGLPVFVPVSAVSLVGVSALKRRFRFGRWCASAGAVTAALFYAALVFVVIEDAAAPQASDPTRWAPELTPITTILVVVPYILGIAASAYVISRLWWPRTSTSGTMAAWPPHQ